MPITPKPINWKAFLAIFSSMRIHGVSYEMGAKVASLNEDPHRVRSIDCSGFARYVVYNSAGGLVIPDGSWIQREWCEKNLVEVPYGEAKGELNISFMTVGVNGVTGSGHVWFVKDGMTYESHGHTVGIDSRPWDYATLKNHVHKTFRWPLAAIGTFALLGSNGVKIDDLLLFDGRSYVAARKLGTWFGAKIDWNPHTATIYINGHETSANRIINSDGYVKFQEAAAIIGLVYTVNNSARQIDLVAIVSNG